MLKGKHLILALTVALVLIADQATKILAIVYLEPLTHENRLADQYVTVIDGFFRLKYTENAGAAWGLFRNASRSFRIPFFIVISLAAIGVIVWFYRKLEAQQKLLPLAVSLILGGAVGNLIDRVRMGKVVDFVDWYVTFDKPYHWPTFNVADAAISVGVVLLLVEMFIGKKKE